MVVLNEEQLMLRDMARDWATEQSPVGALRKLRDGGDAARIDRDAYGKMAEMGWTGVIVPEAHGGSEFGYLGLGLVLEETARTLTASPLLASALGATSALLVAGTEEQKAAWLPKIAAGEAIGTLAVDEGTRHDPTAIETKAERAGDGWTLTGTKAYVPEGDSADLFVVVARTDAGLGMFLVPRDAEGVSVSTRTMVDSRSHAFVSLEGASLGADALLGEADGEAALTRVLDRARIGAATEILGLSSQAFDITLDYLKTREQFGERLSRFQALQHRMARLYTEIELMRSTVEAALVALDEDRADVPVMASLAKAIACDTGHLMSREVIQLHGGIGMTDDYDAGFYLKRMRVLEQLWGNAGFHRERFARLSGY